MIMCIQKLVSISLFVLKILKKTDFLCQSRAVTLLQICEKWQFTVPNVDLVNDNVYTKFSSFLSIHVNDMLLNKLR